ncbi:MFS transporter [Amycolatopsis viridis]|uniref:EmrB/QacA subfamily drug resistance transporter n=1 Tax=Amycolatopsis viridis TaxID=185678 RepID=A0ABX0SV33_9PSEU|nr:MFS transporter [Amycolatopsis viridis]NIH80831.1 EmrB/QacA subfamily drug resistance transporter [Amycolatopsis viridis]
MGERVGGKTRGRESAGGADAEVKAPVTAWLSLLAVALGIMVVQLDGSVVSVANPTIATSLHASLEGIQWVTTGYLLVLAGLLIPAGLVADKIGRKKAFLIGIGGFSLASLLCGLSGSIDMLIGARVLQAVFGAMLGPAGLAVLRAAFPPEKLSTAFGWFGSVSAVALAGGPILGGVLVEYASWPWVFYINLPFGIVAVLVGVFVIKESTQRVPQRLDLPGAMSLTLALVTLIWGVTRAQSSGWWSVNTLGFMGLGVVLLIVFLIIENRSKAPMVPLSLFRIRSFSIGCLVTIVTMFAFFAILFYLTFYLQGVQGKSALMAAVALLPLTLVFTVASPVAGAVTGRLGNRGTLLLGAACTTASLLLLLRLGVGSGTVTLAPSLVLAGFGAGFMMIPAIEAIVGSAPVDKAGVASGIQQSTQQLGGTLGIAVFGSLLASVVSAKFGGALAAAFGGDTDAVAQVAGNEQLRKSVELGFPPAVQDALRQQMTQSGLDSGDVQRFVGTVSHAAHETFLSGMHQVFLVAACCAAAAGLLSLLIRAKKADAASEDVLESAR